MISRRMMFGWISTTAVVAIGLAIYTYDTPALSPDPTGQAMDAPGTAALRAANDPETGELVIGVGVPQPSGDSDKALDAELEKMLSRSDEGLEAITHPDGRVSVHLKGRFMNASVARINSGGQLETLCTEHSAEAHNFLDPATEVDSHGREVR